MEERGEGDREDEKGGEGGVRRGEGEGEGTNVCPFLTV